MKLPFCTKKKAPRVKRSSDINYRCADDGINAIIHNYYNGVIPATRCIQSLLRHIESHDQLRVAENKVILPILEDLLCSATWKDEWDYSCGDFTPGRTDIQFSCIYRAYGDICRKISDSKEILRARETEETPETIFELCKSNPHITIEMVSDTETLAKKQEELKAVVLSGELSPLDVVKIIKANWNVMYAFGDTYQTLDYCITCSNNHTIPGYIDAAFRDIGNTFNTEKENQEK